MRVRNDLFWHVYGNINCSKIVDVTQTIFVTIFIGHDVICHYNPHKSDKLFDFGIFMAVLVV